jgi:hypothetical protein
MNFHASDERNMCSQVSEGSFWAHKLPRYQWPLLPVFGASELVQNRFDQELHQNFTGVAKFDAVPTCEILSGSIVL